jgi:HEAT repeat protein
VLIQSLGSQVISVRRNAVWAVGQFGPAARGAAGDLVGLMEDEDPVIRVEAAASLWRIERNAKAASKLTEMLRSNDATGSFAAAVALGELGPEVPGALKALVEALRHPDEDTRRAATRSLGRLGPVAIPELRQMLKSSEAATRRRAVESLGWMGAPAAPLLRELLNDADPAIRDAAVRAVRRTEPAL